MSAEALKLTYRRVSVGLAIECPADMSPQESIELVCDWIYDFSLSRRRFNRFVGQLDTTIARYWIDTRHNVPLLSGQRLIIPHALAIEIGGGSRILALERFRNWSAALVYASDLNRQNASDLPNFQIRGDEVVSERVEIEIEESLGDLFYSGWRKWESNTDNGPLGEADRLSIQDFVQERNKRFETDLEKEAVLALTEFSEHLKRIRPDPHDWRWAILSLHFAMQAYMVLALRGTWDVLTWEDAAMKQALADEHSAENIQIGFNAKLAGFLVLYRRIKKKNLMERGRAGAVAFTPADGDTEAVKWLNRIRNELQHFKSSSWSIDTDSFAKNCMHCLSVVEFLAWKSNKIDWDSNLMRLRSDDAIVRSKSLLADLIQEA